MPSVHVLPTKAERDLPLHQDDIVSDGLLGGLMFLNCSRGPPGGGARAARGLRIGSINEQALGHWPVSGRLAAGDALIEPHSVPNDPPSPEQVRRRSRCRAVRGPPLHPPPPSEKPGRPPSVTLVIQTVSQPMWIVPAANVRASAGFAPMSHRQERRRGERAKNPGLLRQRSQHKCRGKRRAR